MTDRSVIHATFSLERTYPAVRERVFAAFANQEQKRQWAYGAPEGSHTLDFKIGGKEHVEMPGPGGGTFVYDGIIQDIVENERVIYAYSFAMGGPTCGITLTTVELADASGGGTHLKLTEQGAYLDGFDGPKFWEAGTTSLLNRLGAFLQ